MVFTHVVTFILKTVKDEILCKIKNSFQQRYAKTKYINHQMGRESLNFLAKHTKREITISLSRLSPGTRARSIYLYTAENIPLRFHALATHHSIASLLILGPHKVLAHLWWKQTHTFTAPTRTFGWKSTLRLIKLIVIHLPVSIYSLTSVFVL